MANTQRLLLLSVALVAGGASLVTRAEGNAAWAGTPDQPVRMQADGLKLYYEPEKVGKDENLVSVALYASSDLANTKVVEEYRFHCSRHEVAQAAFKGGNKEWQAPMALLPGERLYKFASKLCEWDSSGFWKKLVD